MFFAAAFARPCAPAIFFFFVFFGFSSIDSFFGFDIFADFLFVRPATAPLHLPARSRLSFLRPVFFVHPANDAHSEKIFTFIAC